MSEVEIPAGWFGPYCSPASVCDGDEREEPKSWYCWQWIVKFIGEDNYHCCTVKVGRWHGTIVVADKLWFRNKKDADWYAREWEACFNYDL